MALNKLTLRYKPEDEDIQEATKMNFLVGKVEFYRKRASFTDMNIRAIPEHDRFEYVRRDRKCSFKEFHDFSIQTMEALRVPLNKEQFPWILGDNYWNIVLTIPRKVVRVPKISQRTELFVRKIFEENYSYLIPEIDSLKLLDSESALRIATTLEEAMNISKLEADDPFQKRTIEDLQWNMIEIKKTLYNIVDNVKLEESKKKLIKYVSDLEKKLLALDEIGRTLDKMGVDEERFVKEFVVKKRPNGRVEFLWKRSG